MKTIPALVLAAVVSVGLLGGVVAYQLASGPAGPSSSASAAPVTPVGATAPRTHQSRPKVRWAPCEPPAVRQGKACVTEEVRTVVVPAPAAPRSTTTRPAPVAQPVRAEDDRDDSADREDGEDHAEHADDDHGNDHADDDGEHDGEHEDD